MRMVCPAKMLQRYAASLLIPMALFYGAGLAPARAQEKPSSATSPAPAQDARTQEVRSAGTAQDPAGKPQSSDATSTTPPVLKAEDQPPKRILWIIPNYRSVYTSNKLPVLGFKDKFWLATQDSFDYSSFIVTGMLAGVAQAKNSTPEFRQGAAGYGRYYWHSFADQAVGNYFTEAIVPVATREDPRYYTLGHGGFFRRSAYAVSRLLITRTDSGGRSFNFSEIVGNGAGAGISDLYYPRAERTWTKTGQKWLLQVGLDGAFNMAKEFWPDIDRAIFHGHYESRKASDSTALRRQRPAP